MSWKLIEKTKDILEKEKGTIYKQKGELSFLLAYPNYYRVGMANLGFQSIYAILNTIDGVSCERVFLPEIQDEAELRKKGTLLFSLENLHPANEFDIIGFSVCYENDYINILKILDLGGIPIQRDDRAEEDPLVIAGGACIFANPEPLSPFIDIFIIGEGEEVLPELINTIIHERKKLTRKELFYQLSYIEGVYVPEFYDVKYDTDGKIHEIKPKDSSIPFPVKRRWVKNLDKYAACSIVSTPEMEFGDMFLIEMGRGCSKKCRFCLAGQIYLPPRGVSIEKIMAKLDEGMTEKNIVGLMGTAICDFPQIEELCDNILKNGWRISASSLRIDSLTKGLLNSLSSSGQQTVTLAPETGTERLRRAIGKDISNEEIFQVCEDAFTTGIPNLKLYFMIGLPTETDDDVRAIEDLIKKIQHRMVKVARDKGRLGMLSVSISCFVPKPFTPFQWVAMDDMDSLKKKLKYLDSSLRKISNVNVNHELPKWSFIQGLLSRGDRRAGNVILKAFNLREDWNQAIRQSNINPYFYVNRIRDKDEIFPWEVLDIGVSKEYLWQEYLKAGL